MTAIKSPGANPCTMFGVRADVIYYKAGSSDL